MQRSGCPGQSVILFDYAPSRSGRVPRRLLAGWQGYPVADRGEACAVAATQRGLTHFGCWVHAYPSFIEAAKVLPPGVLSGLMMTAALAWLDAASGCPASAAAGLWRRRGTPYDGWRASPWQAHGCSMPMRS